MKKKDHLNKTLVEKILDKHRITYDSLEFATEEEHHVAQLDLAKITIEPENIYKTLALTGNKTGPVIAVIPLTHVVDYKKLAHISGNKKVGMIPLKDLEKTTGYIHGANTPIGIHETHSYPIFIADLAQKKKKIIVSAGKVGRSVGISPLDLEKLVQGTFADISSEK